MITILKERLITNSFYLCFSHAYLHNLGGFCQVGAAAQKPDSVALSGYSQNRCDSGYFHTHKITREASIGS